jgi:hypothetical protein
MDLSIGPTDQRDRPPLVAGFKGTPEEIERQWYEQVYRGRGDSMAQLTWRAVLIGSCLGGVLSLTNLYIGLKAGWGFGVAITASILSYAIWTSLLKVRLVRMPMTILENNCMQSTASSAGYSTGGTLVSAFAAYIIINMEMLALEEPSARCQVGRLFALSTRRYSTRPSRRLAIREPAGAIKKARALGKMERRSAKSFSRCRNG